MRRRIGRAAVAASLCAPLLALSADLSHALKTSLRRHPAVGSQMASVEASARGIETAETARYPSVSAQAQQTSGGVALSDPFTLRVRQPLWAFGRIDSTIYRAEIEFKAEEVNLLRVKRQLIDATAAAFATAVGARERRDVAQENVLQLRELHAQIQRREVGELASRADVVLATARLSQAISQFERSESEWQQSLKELKAQTLEDIDPDPVLDDALLSRDPVSRLIELALQESADVLVRRQQLTVAKAQTEETRKSAMPTVYLQLDRQPGYGPVPEVTRTGLAIEAGLDGMGLTVASRAREAAARELAAEEGIRNAQNDVERMVWSLVSKRDLAAAMVKAQALSEEQLTQLLASYQRQYAAGTKQWIDVLNIQRELTEQKLLTIQARSDERINALRLSALLGRLDKAAGM